MAVLLLIRHGENDLIGKGLAGRMPGVHLNGEGRRQAQELAAQLGGARLKAIYSSPLERALETAQPLASRHGLPVQVREGLIEVDYGRWQGRSFKQLRRTSLWKQVLVAPAGVRFPGGESLAEVQERAVEEMERIAADHEAGDLVALFTHAEVIRLATAHYLKMPLNEFQRLAADTASLTVLVHRDGRVMVPQVNQRLPGEAFHAWEGIKIPK